MTVRAVRGDLYHLARLLGDVNAVQQSVHQRSVKPVIKRVVRKRVYREEFRLTNRVLNAAFRGL